MFFRLKKSGQRGYVQIVENRRDGAAVRQRVIANLGRADELAASGALASLIASGAKLTDLGARECSEAIMRKVVLENDDPFVPLLVERKAGETQLFVKQVKVEGARYAVCRNEAEAENDRKDREAIVAALDAQLKKGDKGTVRNLVCGAIVTPMEGAYGNQERHPGRFAGGA
jgi:hypothetical protein